MRGLTIPDACPAEIEVLSTAVGRDGRWYVLSAGGRTARCWPVDMDRPFGAPDAEPRADPRRPGPRACARP